MEWGEGCEWAESESDYGESAVERDEGKACGEGGEGGADSDAVLYAEWDAVCALRQGVRAWRWVAVGDEHRLCLVSEQLPMYENVGVI